MVGRMGVDAATWLDTTTWVPQINQYMSLRDVVEFAFDYRGNTMVVKGDGSGIVAGSLARLTA